jgi:hypothetical protein
MLKKLLMTTAVLVALIGNSHADPRSLPSSMHGLWCNAGKVGKIERYVRGRCKKDESDDFLEVAVAHVEGHEWGCDFRKVVIVGRTYKVSSKCGGEGMLSDEEATIWLDGRFLMYRVDRTSNERPELGTLVCANHRSTPPDSDPDPVIRTILNFEDTFAVTHVSRSGKAYVRGDQYRDVKVWDDEKGPHWSGIWKRNPNKRMTGTLVYEGNNNRYIEETYDGGRLETTMVSTCEKEEVSNSTKSSSSSANAAVSAEYECAGYRSVPPEAVERGPGRQDLGHHAFFRRHAHHARG